MLRSGSVTFRLGFVPGKRATNSHDAQSLPQTQARRIAQLGGAESPPLEQVDWFYNRRLLEPIGNLPLAEAEVDFQAVRGMRDVLRS
jgi:hypothetical protein